MDAPAIGQPFQASLWFNAERLTEKDSAKSGIRKAINMAAAELGVTFGPVQWEERGPEDAGVPPVPDHFAEGTPRVMIGEARVVAISPAVAQKTFIGELSAADLDGLRNVTRQAYRKKYPTRPALTDAQCDEIIEFVGPQTEYRVLTQAINAS